MKKLLIMVCPLKPQGSSGAMTTNKNCFFETVPSQILKIGHQKIYLYVSLNTYNFLEP